MPRKRPHAAARKRPPAAARKRPPAAAKRASRAPARRTGPSGRATPRSRPGPAGLFRVLAPDGRRIGPAPSLAGEDLAHLLEAMIRIRVLDQRMLMAQRQGRIAFYGTATGQEGAVIGSAAALAPEDWIFPGLREQGALLLRGYTIREYLLHLTGRAGDTLRGRQMPCHPSERRFRFVSMSSCIGTQIPHATGAALAAKHRGDGTVVAAYFGDGATSEPDFHTGLNFAGVWKVPCVFVCQNNQWAISVPFARQTASDGIAVKAEAYGMEGYRVDGNDVLAVHEAMRLGVERARRGEGPSLLECVTYRIGAHSSSDDWTRYRPEDEVRRWLEKDPIERMRRYLESRGLWDEDHGRALEERITREIQAALQEVESLPPPDTDTLFEDVYATPPPHLAAQRERLREETAWRRRRGLPLPGEGAHG